VATLVCASLVGCATSRLTQEPGLVNAAPPIDPAATVASAAGIPRVAIVLYARQLRFDVPVSSYFGPHWKRRSTAKRLGSAVAEFPFLIVAATDGSSGTHTAAPYRLVIEASHATGGNKKWSKLSKLTNYLVPSVEESAVELEGRLMRDGALVKTYEARGTYKTKKHLLFVLAPWMWKLSVPSRTTADTFRDLFLQVQRDAGTVLTASTPEASAPPTPAPPAPAPTSASPPPAPASPPTSPPPVVTPPTTPSAAATTPAVPTAAATPAAATASAAPPAAAAPPAVPSSVATTPPASPAAGATTSAAAQPPATAPPEATP
jgi:hypothetical protein